MPDPEPKLTEAQERAIVWMYENGCISTIIFTRGKEMPIHGNAVRSAIRAGLIRTRFDNGLCYLLTPLGVRIAERIMERGK